MSVVRAALETAGGVYELGRLAVLSRLRLRGKYWRWRVHTAFGRGLPAGRAELVRGVLGYARWVWRMRHGR